MLMGSIFQILDLKQLVAVSEVCRSWYEAASGDTAWALLIATPPFRLVQSLKQRADCSVSTKRLVAQDARMRAVRKAALAATDP
eukprot:SAG22_NODE_20638_length_264_cov_0.618182_1_plen_83_part_10